MKKKDNEFSCYQLLKIFEKIMSENKGVEFELLNPSGNITGLVTKDYPREKYQEIANKIMESNSQVEQVGFLKKYSDSISFRNGRLRILW